MGCAFELGYIPNVFIGWRNIEISANYESVVWLSDCVGVLSQFLHPPKFVFVMIVV